MDDLLLALLEILAEIFFQAAFEFIVEYVGALVLRAIVAVFDASEPGNTLLASLGYIILGAAAGGLSLLVFPHPLIHRSRVPGVSLIVSPVLAGLGMSFVGLRRRRREKRVLQIESFSCGFAFALGMAVVRFFFTSKL